MNNVTLNLKNESGNVVGTTTTNSSGVYSFTGVGNGNYTLEPSTNKAWVELQLPMYFCIKTYATITL